MINLFNRTSTLNHKKIVIKVFDDDIKEDNPTLYIGDLF